MEISKRGIDFIKAFEGLQLKAYVCPAGVLTIGYGTTSGVTKGMVITESKAADLLKHDLERFERAVNRYVSVELTQGQYDALVSFCYNCGEGNLKSSTLLKKVNAGDFAGAVKEFAKWNKGGGRVIKGLTRRRAEEADLFAS